MNDSTLLYRYYNLTLKFITVASYVLTALDFLFIFAVGPLLAGYLEEKYHWYMPSRITAANIVGPCLMAALLLVNAVATKRLRRARYDGCHRDLTEYKNGYEARKARLNTVIHCTVFAVFCIQIISQFDMSSLFRRMLSVAVVAAMAGVFLFLALFPRGCAKAVDALREGLLNDIRGGGALRMPLCLCENSAPFTTTFSQWAGIPFDTRYFLIDPDQLGFLESQNAEVSRRVSLFIGVASGPDDDGGRPGGEPTLLHQLRVVFQPAGAAAGRTRGGCIVRPFEGPGGIAGILAEMDARHALPVTIAAEMGGEFLDLYLRLNTLPAFFYRFLKDTVTKYPDFKASLALFDYIDAMLRAVSFFVCRKAGLAVEDMPDFTSKFRLMAETIRKHAGDADLPPSGIGQTEYPVAILGGDLAAVLDAIEFKTRGNCITLPSLTELIVQLRNKIRGHGILSETIAMPLFRLLFRIALLFTDCLRMMEFRLEEAGETPLFGYACLIPAGEYIIKRGGRLLFYQAKGKHTDFINGDYFVPDIIDDTPEDDADEQA